MHRKQVLPIIGFFLLHVWTCTAHPCYSESDLEEAANRQLRRHRLQPSKPPTTSSSSGCPVESFSQQINGPTNVRSLSPWTYVIASLPEHFPSTYGVAKCLCKGCIVFDESDNAIHSLNYNSVNITQRRSFLKRERCHNKTTYRLTWESLDVPVGCTCVTPNTIA